MFSFPLLRAFADCHRALVECRRSLAESRELLAVEVERRQAERESGHAGILDDQRDEMPVELL